MDCEIKKSVTEILYQQLQLLAESFNETESIHSVESMLSDFRHIAKTILTNNPTKEQREWILETANKQLGILVEKKSVYLSDSIDDLALFIFQFF